MVDSNDICIVWKWQRKANKCFWKQHDVCSFLWWTLPDEPVWVTIFTYRNSSTLGSVNSVSLEQIRRAFLGVGRTKSRCFNNRTERKEENTVGPPLSSGCATVNQNRVQVWWFNCSMDDNEMDVMTTDHQLIQNPLRWPFKFRTKISWPAYDICDSIYEANGCHPSDFKRSIRKCINAATRRFFMTEQLICLYWFPLQSS